MNLYQEQSDRFYDRMYNDGEKHNNFNYFTEASKGLSYKILSRIIIISSG